MKVESTKEVGIEKKKPEVMSELRGKSREVGIEIREMLGSTVLQ